MLFSKRIITWQHHHGRHHLPWQCDDPYRIWLSEIMLQQTQVNTVIPYYQRFLTHFPHVISLANSHQDEVLALWSGLGYYARARNLHYAAQQIRDDFEGKFPHTRQTLEQLKGVGRSTAAAISVFAYNQQEAILDGNVKRILARHRTLKGDLTTAKNQMRLWQLAESLLPVRNIKAYTQGLMDLGTSICTRSNPKCNECPIQKDCLAHQTGNPNAYPEKKAKKTKPVKTGYFLLCQAENAVLLQKRTEKGIWGNLWALPWFENEKQRQTFAAQYKLKKLPQTTTLTHHFTHYTLILNCYYYQSSYQQKFTEQQLQWFSKKEWKTLGLPTPIKKILTILSL